MTVTVDGEPLGPPPGEQVWRRAGFARVIDQITGQRMTPVRVEVTEADGNTFTEIVAPSRRTPARVPEVHPAPVPAVKTVPVLVEVNGDRFISGEDVAVAIIVAHTDAAPGGQARALLDAAQIPAAETGEVALIGRISGSFVIRRLS
ncbi:hypothetical protein [Microbacterium panaciterrae]